MLAVILFLLVLASFSFLEGEFFVQGGLPIGAILAVIVVFGIVLAVF